MVEDGPQRRRVVADFACPRVLSQGGLDQPRRRAVPCLGLQAAAAACGQSGHASSGSGGDRVRQARRSRSGHFRKFRRVRAWRARRPFARAGGRNGGTPLLGGDDRDASSAGLAPPAGSGRPTRRMAKGTMGTMGTTETMGTMGTMGIQQWGEKLSCQSAANHRNPAVIFRNRQGCLRFPPRHDGGGVISAAIALPGNTAAAFLTDFFGPSLADNSYEVEKFRAMADGEFRRRSDPSLKGGRSRGAKDVISRYHSRDVSDPNVMVLRRRPVSPNGLHGQQRRTCGFVSLDTCRDRPGIRGNAAIYRIGFRRC